MHESTSDYMHGFVHVYTEHGQNAYQCCLHSKVIVYSLMLIRYKNTVVITPSIHKHAFPQSCIITSHPSW